MSRNMRRKLTVTILDTQQACDVFVTLAHCIGANHYSIASNVVRLDATFDGSKLQHRAIAISVEPNVPIANHDYYELVVRDVRYHDVAGAISNRTLDRLSITSSPFNGCNNYDVAVMRIQAILKRDVNALAEWLKVVLDIAGIEIINIVDLSQ